MVLEGGCLCGCIRYRVDQPIIDAGYCHCRLCQRASGAPTVAWLTVPAGGFRYVRGTVAVFASSQGHQREFCPVCGTQIAFRAKVDPRTVDVTLGSLDEPARIEPEYHIWCDSKPAWLHLADGLPRYRDAGPDAD